MEKRERWMLRIPSNRDGDRFLAKMRKYLNTDTYKLSTMYTGPRPKGTSPYSTTKENATSVRLYVDSKVATQTKQTILGVEEFERLWLENTQLKLRLDAAYAALNSIKAHVDWRANE